tara:strand:+ start:34 stop:405 length:372 start_codon:yes stop_codon:yes gene_type:complete
MKIQQILLILLLLISCNKEEENDINIYTGKLVKLSVCSNFVVEVINDNFPKDLIETSWIDEFSGITYNNVFGIGNFCEFPNSISEGETFRFRINNNPNLIPNCAQCLIYTPMPTKYLNISVVD